MPPPSQKQANSSKILAGGGGGREHKPNSRLHYPWPSLWLLRSHWLLLLSHGTGQPLSKRWHISNKGKEGWIMHEIGSRGAGLRPLIQKFSLCIPLS
ncbi:hypothetical protein GDO78_015996 [Eleutherodactylus coqui]|uniref:Uncharacterized protein n=1 Tax=Eleutherodactylus coqui TaxID=57060 RepID=A0A8J6ELB4_ELECQ|nr:hypothetical protein GDO78_015996 [Eleutherodactylus coqui]